MATIVGGIATTHVPSIGNAIAKGLQHDPYWRPFFDGFAHAHAWLEEARPDIAVVFYNDHGLNFFLDKLPTFAIGAAAEYAHADEGWGLPVARPYPGDPQLSWHLIESLVADEFDVTTCQEMLIDHAFTVPLSLLWPGADRRPVRTIPIEINTVQHPLPSLARCFKLGQAVGRAIGSYGQDSRVLIVGTGGLSHQLDGTRAGFINRQFDELCLRKIVDEPEALTRYSIPQLVAEAGTQGVEFLNWIAMRGALSRRVSKVYSNYHIPISNTASALLVLENQGGVVVREFRKTG
ncbi:MAG TPA: class III extradiol dioxygenase family protein [Xanthobacteraceae bacterium]|nr:class III extradiol dioxygenase family protein [Xanthobacteraceae bacterium]